MSYEERVKEYIKKGWNREQAEGIVKSRMLQQGLDVKPEWMTELEWVKYTGRY